MKSNKPKGKTPSLIGGTLGAPKKDIVLKKSACKRCKADILKGIECYRIPQLGGSFASSRPYCDSCFESILEKTKADLDVLFKSIQA